MLNLTNAVSISVDYLYEQGANAEPDAGLYKEVADVKMIPTSSIQLVKSTGPSTMIPMVDGVRSDQVIEMSQHRGDTMPFERTIKINAQQMRDFSYMSGVEEEIWNSGIEKARHPNRLTFGALANANSATYTHQKGGKSATFSMVGIDGQPLLSTSHVVAGATVSNYVSPGGGTGRWYIMAKGARRPLKFLISNDYEMDEDLNSYAESRHYRYRAFAQVGVAVGDWRYVYSSDGAFTEENVAAAIVAMTEFRDDQGDKIGAVPGMVVAPFSMFRAVMSTLESQYLATLQSNYLKGFLTPILSPWL